MQIIFQALFTKKKILQKKFKIYYKINKTIFLLILKVSGFSQYPNRSLNRIMPKTANATLDKVNERFPFKINLPNKQYSYHDIDDS